MIKSIKVCLVLVVMQFLSGLAMAGAEVVISDKEDMALTVYNQDFALVREKRNLRLDKGINLVRLEEIPIQIDPTSVSLKSLSAPESIRILEQNYEFDLVNYGKLLQKYVGKEVEIHNVVDPQKGEVRITKAKLISSGYSPLPRQRSYGLSQQAYNYSPYGQLLFEIDGKIYTSALGGTIALPALPEKFILRPALLWRLESAKSGINSAELSYMTSGINWISDYVAVVDAHDTKLDMTGWVTIDNRSGTGYENARLKLIAGDVHLADDNIRDEEVYGGLLRSSEKSAPQFQEKSFFEYHLYTLQRPATINDNEIKQIEFTSAANIKLTKSYLYDGLERSGQYRNYDKTSYRSIPDYMSSSKDKVAVILEFKNSQDNHLGIPLPKGRMRIYKKDEDGSQEFIGEDTIDHTPKDETVKLYAGNAFDIVGERKQLDFKVIDPSHIIDETFEITLRNHKKEDLTVTVREHLYRWNEWEIKNTTHSFEKKDAQTIEFNIPVAKDSQSKLVYTVRYKW